MTTPDHKFWPYKPKVSVMLAILVFVVLLIALGASHSIVHWPPDTLLNVVFIVVVVISLLPILLAILDVIIDRGGTIGYGDFKIDFSKAAKSGSTGFTISTNIGVRGRAVTDSDTVNILESLKQATSSSISVIDLEDGSAWWETRLFVLLCGAERLGRPKRLVFIATRAGLPQVFEGWGDATDLFECFLKMRPQFQHPLYVARAAANQWNLVEPLYPAPLTPPPLPQGLPWMQATAAQKSWEAFDHETGLPNELFQELLLQNELGREIEVKDGGAPISISRLNELFESVLIKDVVDTTHTAEKQITSFLSSDAPFIALTQGGRYSALVSRQALYNEALKSVFGSNGG